MAEFSHKDVVRAIRNILRGEHEFTDATRLTAQREVRNICRDRIDRGRRKVDIAMGPFVTILKTGVTRVYHLGGEEDCVESTLEIMTHSLDADENDRLQDAIRQSLTSMKVAVVTGSDTITIGGCTLDDDGDFEPEEPRDASRDYVFQYRQLWRINHDQVVPSGVS